VAAWQHGAKQLHGYHMGKWEYAEDKSSSCSKGVEMHRISSALSAVVSYRHDRNLK
jgi:hypothetical protein